MLRKETAQALGNWIFQDIICRWGMLVEIVSDNGKPFVVALGYIEKKYHIKHIRISGYNSRANGIVEQSHFDVRQALFKTADGEQGKWSQVAYSAFWSERVTPRHRMGCLPNFTVTVMRQVPAMRVSEQLEAAWDREVGVPPGVRMDSKTGCSSHTGLATRKQRVGAHARAPLRPAV